MRNGIRGLAIGLSILSLTPGLTWGASAINTVALSQSPQTVIRDATTRALKAIGQLPAIQLANPLIIYRLISKCILPEVDIKSTSRLVLGRFWRSATPKQRKAFVKEFTKTLIRTYSTVLRQVPSPTIRYLTNRDTLNGSFASVYTQAIRPGHESVTVIYHLFKTKTGWKIYDVSISGLSLVMSYRSAFSSAIERNGLQALINRLRQQNAKFDQKIPGS